MFAIKHYVYSGMIFLPFLVSANFLLAGELSPSTEVQKNISLLQETKSCPQCNLSGANLNRLDLSGANLEGANLSRAKLYLTNLSGANLRNADLREAGFGGADLAEADLRGADLAGTSLVGAYMNGALLDGEMISTRPYAQDKISNIEETVYVDDTVNSKAPPEPEEMTIGTRRDFEETPPPVPVRNIAQETEKQSSTIAEVENVTTVYDEETQAALPGQSAAAPEAKAAPAIQDVRIQEEAEPAILHADTTKKHLSDENIAEPKIQEQEIAVEPQGTDEIFTETNEMSASVQQSDTQEKPVEVVEKTEVVEIAEQEKPDTVDTEVSQETAEPYATLVTEGIEPQVAVERDEDASEIFPVTVNDEGKDDDTEVVRGTVGFVESMLNVFSTPEPSTEVMRNVAVLLDTKLCYGCNLSGVNLSGENLVGADLEDADLSNAVLKDVDFEGANLKGANLSGADLSEADLSGADLYKAVLTNADLTDAKLEDTLLDGADLSGVKGYQQTLMLME